MVTKGELISSSATSVRSANAAQQIGPLTIRTANKWKLELCLFFGFLIAGLAFKPMAPFAVGWCGVLVFRTIFNLAMRRSWNESGLSTTLSSDGVESHSGANPPGKKLVPWSQLRLLGLHRAVWRMPMESKESRTIVFNFPDIPDMAINLNALSSSEQEHLFRIISRNVPQRVLSPEVLYMQIQSLSGEAPTTDGYTQRWSDEFDRRFELANHVSLEAGRNIGNGRYTVELTIATRMSSSTYLVSDGKGQRFVAKELVVPFGADENVHEKLLQQFNREAGLLASLSHPLIVSVRDHFVEDGRSYVVMDCVQGANLRQYVRSFERVEKTIVLSIARQLLEVLSYLHTRSPAVIHRDLTPDNIMYASESDEIRVIDFGAANIYSSEGTGTLIGKRGYMPPEQFKGKASPESDVYAFGSTLLFLLTGEDPPGMCRVPEFAEPTGIDENLMTIVRSCLQFEPTDRPAVGDLIAHFESLVERRGGGNEI